MGHRKARDRPKLKALATQVWVPTHSFKTSGVSPLLCKPFIVHPILSQNHDVVFLIGSPLVETIETHPLEATQYDDFHTIDWVRDTQRYRTRRKAIQKTRKDSCWDAIKAATDAGAGWIVVFLVGIAAGKKGLQISQTYQGDLNNYIQPFSLLFSVHFTVTLLFNTILFFAFSVETAATNMILSIDTSLELFKGTYRDHRVTGALNFHKIQDFCILVMVLDV